MPETTPLIKAALNLRGGAGFDVYQLSQHLPRKIFHIAVLYVRHYPSDFFHHLHSVLCLKNTHEIDFFYCEFIHQPTSPYANFLIFPVPSYPYCFPVLLPSAWLPVAPLRKNVPVAFPAVLSFLPHD